jgi:hypothetical protein
VRKVCCERGDLRANGHLAANHIHIFCFNAHQMSTVYIMFLPNKVDRPDLIKFKGSYERNPLWNCVRFYSGYIRNKGEVIMDLILISWHI